MTNIGALKLPDPDIVRVEVHAIRPPGQHEHLVTDPPPSIADLWDGIRIAADAAGRALFDLGVALDQATRATIDILGPLFQVQPPALPAARSGRRHGRTPDWHKRRRRLHGRRG